jgi:hypothetical protein
MTGATPTQQPLIDAIFVDKVRRARLMSPGEKMLDGPRLFDQNCQLMRGAIRSQFPEFDDAQVEQELRRRLAIARRIDEAGIYTNIDETSPDESGQRSER